MPMTIVREGDDEAAIAARLGMPSGAIEIDAVVVDVYESIGVDAETLKRAIVLHRPDFSRRKAPIDVPGGSGVELHGRVEGQAFELDRIVVGDIVYFGAGAAGMPHVTDYTPLRTKRRHDADRVARLVGADLADAVDHRAFRSRRSPVVRGAMGEDRGALHLEVDRIGTSI